MYVSGSGPAFQGEVAAGFTSSSGWFSDENHRLAANVPVLTPLESAPASPPPSVPELVPTPDELPLVPPLLLPLEPELLDPEPLDPEPVDPEPLDPEPLDPEPVDPEPLDPEPVDPEPLAAPPPSTVAEDCEPHRTSATGKNRRRGSARRRFGMTMIHSQLGDW
jgi:hypothetical protein